MIGNAKTLYIQSKPPQNDTLIHHANYSALKKIAQDHALKEGKPYKGISFTTDPGRFLSPMPMFVPTVDGFLEIPCQSWIVQNLVMPVLYRTTSNDESVLGYAKANNYKIFESIPAECKYVSKFAIKNIAFFGENEWLHLGNHLNFHDVKFYLMKKYINRFRRAIEPFYQFQNIEINPI